MQAHSSSMARTAARAFDAQDAVRMAAGDGITQFRMQNAVRPGDRVRVQSEVTSQTGTSIFPAVGGGDTCDTGIFTTGLSIEVVLEVEGEQVDSWGKCMDGTNSEEMGFIAPQEPGEYTVRMVLRGGKSGNTFETQTRTLRVEGNAPGGSGTPPGADQPPSQVPQVLTDPLVLAGVGTGFLLLVAVLSVV